jgi:hypothetical protein
MHLLRLRFFPAMKNKIHKTFEALYLIYNLLVSLKNAHKKIIFFVKSNYFIFQLQFNRISNFT